MTVADSLVTDYSLPTCAWRCPPWNEIRPMPPTHTFTNQRLCFHLLVFPTKKNSKFACSHFQVFLLTPAATLTRFDWHSMNMGKQYPTILTLEVILNTTPPPFHFLKFNVPKILLMHVLKNSITANLKRRQLVSFCFHSRAVGSIFVKQTTNYGLAVKTSSII